MRKRLIVLFTVLVVGSLGLTASLKTIRSVPVVIAESSRGKSSLEIPTYDYKGYAYVQGHAELVSGTLPAHSARSALAMALNIERYIGMMLKFHRSDPRRLPAVLDGLIFWQLPRAQPPKYYQASG